MTKQLDTEYFARLNLICAYIEAGYDLKAAQDQADFDLRLKANTDAQADHDRARDERDWCGND
jgi:hypothetical protein